MNNYIVILFTLSLIISIAEFYTCKYYSKIWEKKRLYEKIELLLILYIHHFIFAYVAITFPYILFNYKTIHIKYIVLYIFTLLLIPFHWYTNNNKCYITEIQKQLLEIKGEYNFRNIYMIITNKYNNYIENIQSGYLYLSYMTVALTITIGLLIVRTVSPIKI